MHSYFVKTPWLVKKLFSSFVWDMPSEKKEIYLTFDDGPHPTLTPWVLEQLKKYNAKATFFCVGNNVAKCPEVYEQILKEGHVTGNHTFNHVNGWKTSTKKYVEDVIAAAGYIKGNLFRPPYGKIGFEQARVVQKELGSGDGKIIMWDVLSADFDPDISSEQCLKNVIQHTVSGSIIVFHDSEKAQSHLSYTLPKVLAHFADQNFLFKAILLFRNK